MTSIMGGRAEDEWRTMFPLPARDHALTLQEENRIREAAGQPRLPFDDTLTEARAVSPRNPVRKAHRPTRRMPPKPCHRRHADPPCRTTA